MLMLLLEMDGFGVVTASSSQEALQFARENQFDIYITEQRLPDGLGTELCAQLREFAPDTPVLYYTAMAGEKHREHALGECGDAYLDKPVCIADFKETILRLLIEAENQRIATAADFADEK